MLRLFIFLSVAVLLVASAPQYPPRRSLHSSFRFFKNRFPIKSTFLSRSRSQTSSATESITFQSRQQTQGLTGDLCGGNNMNCQGSRSCLELESNSACGPCSAFCACMPEEIEVCETTTDCPEGEVCAYGDGRKECVSPFGVTLFDGFSPLIEDGQPGVALYFESCLETSQCVSPYACVVITTQQPCAIVGTTQSDESEECLCVGNSPKACLDDIDCFAGEVCANAFNPQILSFAPICVSEALAKTNPDYIYQGVTGEQCHLDKNCFENFFCRTPTGDTCDGKTGCRCRPASVQRCDSHDDCTIAGEVCATCTTLGENICIADHVAALDATTEKLVCDGQSESSESSSGRPEFSPSILPTLEVCRDLLTDTAVSPIPITTPTPSDIPATSSDPPGMSSDPTSTISVQPTPSGESTTSPQQIDPGVSPTISVQPVPSEESAPEETDSGVCIDAGALRHLDANELVFETHSMARVLCDLNESCATPGHIVQFEGMAMRMSSYCQLVWCNEKVMYVNSPRYRKRLRIKSKTDGLLFTALAARYNTRVEEIVLCAAVHIGV